MWISFQFGSGEWKDILLVVMLVVESDKEEVMRRVFKEDGKIIKWLQKRIEQIFYQKNVKEWLSSIKNLFECSDFKLIMELTCFQVRLFLVMFRCFLWYLY